MEKPALFSTEMVRAILEGRKRMTRRPLNKKHYPVDSYVDLSGAVPEIRGKYQFLRLKNGHEYGPVTAPCFPGDTLWTRETWYYEEHMHDLTAGEPDLPGGRYSHRYVYKASNPDYPVNVGVGEHGWKPSIHMPRAAARIFLKVKSVRVERLQDITEDDCEDEGMYPPYACRSESGYRFEMRTQFKELWDSIYAKRGYGWDTSPWVWVIEFERQ